MTKKQRNIFFRATTALPLHLDIALVSIFCQMNQDRFNGAVCVGSCGLYRRAAVEPFGGVAAISHSEDMYTGFKMTEIGYKV